MRSRCHAIVIILVGLLTLFISLGAAGAQAASPLKRQMPLAFTTRMTSDSSERAPQPQLVTVERMASATNTATSDTSAGSVNTNNPSTATNDLQPSPPSGIMSFSAWLALAAFIVGVIGLVAAALVLRRINE